MSNGRFRWALLVAGLLVGRAPAASAQTMQQGETVAAADAVSDPSGNMAWGVIAGGVSGLSATGSAILDSGVISFPAESGSGSGSGPPTLGFPPAGAGGGGGGCAAGGPRSPAAALPLVLIGIVWGLRRRRLGAGPAARTAAAA